MTNFEASKTLLSKAFGASKMALTKARLLNTISPFTVSPVFFVPANVCAPFQKDFFVRQELPGERRSGEGKKDAQKVVSGSP